MQEVEYIDQFQYTVLVITVIGSAVVPTLIAQSYFRPETPEPGLETRPAVVTSAV